MRVYEFAKEKDLSSREVLEKLKKLGFDLPSHMSVIPDDALELLSPKKTSKSISPKEEISSKSVTAQKAVTPEAVASKEVHVPKKVVVPVEDLAVDEGVGGEFGHSKKKHISPNEAVVSKHHFEQETESTEEEASSGIAEIIVEKEAPLFRVAGMMGKTEGEVILALLKRGIACNRNFILPINMISDLAHNFGIKVIVPKKEEPVSGKPSVSGSVGKGQMRWPIVVVMGHVDHGKTTLLDYIRKMNTAAREVGGITQHLSAYEVDSTHGKVIFLDTPGHEAFSYMRKRGTSVTDMVVLVIAADDGVMPQTIEVIKHAKAAEVPILVAINKIDKVDASSSLERVKRQLAQHDLLPEDWGGTVICVPISAKTGQGVDELLEMITLQAQMMELAADVKAPARGFVLESKQEKGLGSVVTVICLNGTLHVGDFFVCGSSFGRVRLLIDSTGKRVNSAGPSIPVQVVGFENFVSLGDWLVVVSRDEYAAEKSSRKHEGSGLVGFEQGSDSSSIPLIIKTDTHGSSEAISGAIKKVNKALPHVNKKFQIVQSSVGTIIERDIELASHIGAHVIGLHVDVEKNALALAKESRVRVDLFDIIYKMTEFLEELLKTHEEIVTISKKVGEAVVRKVFDLKKRGVIAGCYVTDGVFGRDNRVECIRDGEKIGGGKITSLQRERKVVKEVHAGYECGFITDSFHEWQEGDVVHCFVEEKKKRSEVK